MPDATLFDIDLANGRGKRLTTQQSVNSLIWSVCDILRRSNYSGALQYVPELTWILFLRILDETEIEEAEAAEAVGQAYTPSLQPPYRWQDWAAPAGSKRVALEHGALGAFLSFLNSDLLPYLKGLRHQRPHARR
jgi:type I restriction enzyme M protein